MVVRYPYRFHRVIEFRTQVERFHSDCLDIRGFPGELHSREDHGRNQHRSDGGFRHGDPHHRPALRPARPDYCRHPRSDTLHIRGYGRGFHAGFESRVPGQDQA